MLKPFWVSGARRTVLTAAINIDNVSTLSHADRHRVIGVQFEFDQPQFVTSHKSQVEREMIGPPKVKVHKLQKVARKPALKLFELGVSCQSWESGTLRSGLSA